MRNLEEIRPDIDRVDRQLKELFLERMHLVDEVGIYKKEHGLPVKNQDREDNLIAEKLQNLSCFTEETESFFRNMIDISCDYQERLMSKKRNPVPSFSHVSRETFFRDTKTVCYQGIPGSYSHEVCSRLFHNAAFTRTDSFREVFEKVSQGACTAGVVPIENITAGAVTEVYEALNEMDLYIAASPILPIRHVLMGMGTREEVQTVTSHPQALSQCGCFIRSNGFERIPAPNTAVAAKLVRDAACPDTAAIGSKAAADLYGLKVLEENIADTDDNKTRFIVITKKPLLLTGADTISMIFSIPHHVGSLSRVLQHFAQRGLNMTMIESMPLKGGKWEYLFYVDVKGNAENLKSQLESMGYLFDYFKITGNYQTIEL
ncbi:bifunctional chorismate mutase/prephenate dehydratase [Acetivibrio sp. MSJd-27]|uniref:bifunctional chorismate mutase/prephenate dehydratase n=1 Tax=Acetivibrio sp. MSJd-27 TaxID=2841523 RepID=UPI001C11E1BA|nr:bifunctional chorismate mutase/prephenate dehydratase [Acetivibrio sp. MSJd-27]MBU5449284.1 bifunctional chorismate mutase/prephenate dehydratase [Acetivibrio sp. MSJd-27]